MIIINVWGYFNRKIIVCKLFTIIEDFQGISGYEVVGTNLPLPIFGDEENVVDLKDEQIITSSIFFIKLVLIIC